MQELYRQVVMEHYRRPHNHGDLPDATHAEGGHNPSCGDQLQLMLRLRGGVIEEARFTAQGCAISVASASLMTGLLKGRTIPQALDLARRFSDMLRSGAADPQLGECAALSGVSSLPARVKCASLPWQTLRVLLERAGGEPAPD